MYVLLLQERTFLYRHNFRKFNAKRNLVFLGLNISESSQEKISAGICLVCFCNLDFVSDFSSFVFTSYVTIWVQKNKERVSLTRGRTRGQRSWHRNTTSHSHMTSPWCAPGTHTVPPTQTLIQHWVCVCFRCVVQGNLTSPDFSVILQKIITYEIAYPCFLSDFNIIYYKPIGSSWIIHHSTN